jgi:Ala-tRNA(Pro) deacylase
MALTPEELLARLAALGINAVTHRHPPLHTVEESKRLRGVLPGAHCKNLFLKDKREQVWLVVTLEDKPIDMKALRRRIGAAHLSFGRPELLREVLGVAPGSVTPFALANDAARRVRVVLDAEMMAAGLLNYHPLVNTMTTALAPAELLRFIDACGHRPEIVAL